MLNLFGTSCLPLTGLFHYGMNTVYDFFFNAMSIMWYGTKNVVFKIV